MPTVEMKPLDKFLLYVVRYGLFAVFALPFVVWLSHLYPWVTGKVFSFVILVEVLFPAYVLLALRRREFRPSRNPLLYALLAYFAVETLSMLLGDNAHRSLWSKPDRLTGLFFQYHLLAFFLMAGAVWRKVMVQPIVASIVTAVLLSLQALHQVFSPAPGSDGRGSATLGNPDYLGQYLVPHLFLCGWLIRRHWKTSLRWLWTGAGALILAGIVSAQSKGALVGVAIGVDVARVATDFLATNNQPSLFSNGGGSGAGRSFSEEVCGAAAAMSMFVGSRRARAHTVTRRARGREGRQAGRWGRRSGVLWAGAGGAGGARFAGLSGQGTRPCPRRAPERGLATADEGIAAPRAGTPAGGVTRARRADAI